MIKGFVFAVLLFGFNPVVSWGQDVSQEALMNKIKVNYARMVSYKGELDIVKNSVHERAGLEYAKGRTVLRYTLGPQKGKEFVIKKGVVLKEVFGVKVPIPVPSKVFREANGDIGPGYAIARMNEEMEKGKAGVPIKTEIKDLGKRVTVLSHFVGNGNYRYQKAEVIIDKKLFLPVSASYDTDGDGRYDEMYKFSFSDIRFLPTRTAKIANKS